MNTTIDNTILAFLLALKNLKNSLSEDEREELAEVGQQLQLNPNDWDFIEDDLMAIIQANDALSQLYQQAKVKLDALDSPLPSDLLPTSAELENVLPPESEGGRRAYFEGEPDEKSNEIDNTVVVILTNPEPTKTTKKLTSLEKLWQFLNQPILKNDQKT
ncbi:hypothetical protein AFK68_25345 [Hydrocoleum sp. CS-953]|uniref:hypothetical protein n=1 Tax=Hydrocoleum sp. CS-953 TaxID=1671698 RepID=UPI000B9BE535|nr:hypothetical protein [Hydrocoleum sp. CS-953]OZH52285.1 hypothetical protein AFK68_25345 [Hydrocoleum sp. CS-953]